MQPTFAPWMGYFELMAKTDLFIFLDDVEYSHQSWQSRNWFCQNDKPVLFTVPVKKPKIRARICDKTLSNPLFHQSKFIKRLNQMYRSSINLERYSMVLKTYFDETFEDLASKNIYLLERLSEDLGVSVQSIRASKIPVYGSKSDYINSLLEYVGAEEYLATEGSSKYMREYGLDKFVCKVEFFDYPLSKNSHNFAEHSNNFSAMHHILSD